MNVEEPVLARAGRRFKASAEQVFDAWLDPPLISQWMFGPAVRDEEVMRITVDPRVGGLFMFVVRRQGKEIVHAGEYLELVKPRRLKFTWSADGSDESRVTVDIAPQPIGCELSLIHELHPGWAEYLSRTEAAWSHMLGMLARKFGEDSDKPTEDAAD